jgi:transposase
MGNQLRGLLKLFGLRLEWSIMQPVLPNKSRGAPRAYDRRVINGILWRFRTGSPWADVPERYGAYTTCYNRFVRWRKAGVWDRILEAVSQAFDGELQMNDSSCIRLHQHGATLKRGSSSLHGTFPRRPDHQDPCARGCSRPPHSPPTVRGSTQ